MIKFCRVPEKRILGGKISVKQRILFKDYILYEDGRIYSNKVNRFLRPTFDKKGYMVVSLTNEKRKSKQYKLHRLLALSFIPNPNNLPQVNHKDGNKGNNSLNNLEWCDNSYNQLHSYKIGLHKPYSQKSTKRKNAKLSKEDVLFIRKHYIPYDKKYGKKPLCEKFGIGKTCFNRVINYISYTDILPYNKK